MQNPKMTPSTLYYLVKELEKKIVANRITNISVVNSRDFLCSFSIDKADKLLISLNHQSPFVDLLPIQDNPGTTLGKLNDTLRKEIKDGYIVSVEMINNDRILKIRTQKSNDFYEKITRNLIIEFIPFRPNLIITDENDVIIFAAHQSDISKEHPVMKGLIYQAPKGIEYELDSFDKKSYDELVKSYWLESKENRLKEKYEPLLQFFKIKIKSLKKKIKVLNDDIVKANERLINEEYGQMILAYNYDMEELRKYVNDNNLSYDETLSPGVNAGFYFKKYKKAKRTIECDKEEIIKAEKELAEFEYYLKVSEVMNDDELNSLMNEYLPHKSMQKQKKKPISGISFINYHNNKIIFGKNAKKNEEITFKIANHNDIFMHIKDYHGSHVVIQGNNIDNDTLLLGAEICLILSSTTAGDIQYTEVKNVKKGDATGKVNLLNYQLITLNKVRESTIEEVIKSCNL